MSDDDDDEGGYLMPNMLARFLGIEVTTGTTNVNPKQLLREYRALKHGLKKYQKQLKKFGKHKSYEELWANAEARIIIACINKTEAEMDDLAAKIPQPVQVDTEEV